MEVTVEPKTAHHQSFAQAKTTFVRIVDTSCPSLSIGGSIDLCPDVLHSVVASSIYRGPGPLTKY